MKEEEAMKFKREALIVLVIFAFASIALALGGNWRQVGRSGAWRNTIAATSMLGAIYTVESNGKLYVTSAATGGYRQIGNANFGNTKFIFGINKKIYTIERNGNLYEVHVN